MTANSNDLPSDAAIIERSLSYCNESIKTVVLQCRRLQSDEPEDSDFIFRKWADLRFLILTLDRLEKSASIAKNISEISSDVENALQIYRQSLPMLRKFRNIGEHIEDYAIDSENRRDKTVSRGQLQVGSWDGTVFDWLDEKLDVIEAKKIAIELFSTMQKIRDGFIS